MKILLYFNPQHDLAFNLSASLRRIAYIISENQHLTEDEFNISMEIIGPHNVELMDFNSEVETRLQKVMKYNITEIDFSDIHHVDNVLYKILNYVDKTRIKNITFANSVINEENIPMIFDIFDKISINFKLMFSDNLIISELYTIRLKQLIENNKYLVYLHTRVRDYVGYNGQLCDVRLCKLLESVKYNTTLIEFNYVITSGLDYYVIKNIKDCFLINSSLLYLHIYMNRVSVQELDDLCATINERNQYNKKIKTATLQDRLVKKVNKKELKTTSPYLYNLYFEESGKIKK